MLNRDSFDLTSFEEAGVRFNDAPVDPKGGGAKGEPKTHEKKPKSKAPAPVVPHA